MFLLEGLPAIVLGVIVLLLLPNRPSSARWLTAAESMALEQHLAAEGAEQVGREVPTREALTNPKVVALSPVYFAAALYMDSRCW